MALLRGVMELGSFDVGRLVWEHVAQGHGISAVSAEPMRSRLSA